MNVDGISVVKTVSLMMCIVATGAGCGAASAGSAAPSTAADTQLADFQKTRQAEQANLTNFDDLDFNVYSGQKWDQLTKSHAKDIVVHYADGHTSKGLDPHIEELKPMFVFAPDTKVIDHPIRIASGDWTAVSGTAKGTFTQPMPIGLGKTIPPTGKAFTLNMVTIGHWKNGVMTEEWLYWDNEGFMKQIGLAK